tara:strand:+ start:950 stop:2371 length:1422 start_codon:yes stop_codon:yes gene_type:complete
MNEEQYDEAFRRKHPELFRNYRKEPVTAETIKTEGEKPFKDTAQVLAMISRLGIAYQTAVQGDAIRQRYQKFPFRGGDDPLVNVKPIPTKPDYKSIINESQLPGNSILHRPKLQDTFTATEIWGPGGSPTTVFQSTLGSESSDIDITKHPNYFKGIEEFPDKWKRLFLDGGYPPRTYEVFQKSGIENKKFVLDTWQRLGSDREAIALVGNPIFSDNTFQATRAALLPDFLEELGNVPGIKPELHHVFSLRASAPLFDGLTVGSREWKSLIRTLVSEGVYPGNNPQNLKLIADLPHDVVHKYLDDVIGRQGEVFFDSKTIESIQGKDRLKVARKYAALVRNSEDILIKTQKAYAIARPERIPPATPDEVVSVLENIDPYSKYTLDEITNIIKEVDSELPSVPSLVDGSLEQEDFDNWFGKLQRSERWHEMGQAEQMKYLKEQTKMTYEQIDAFLRSDPDFNLESIFPSKHRPNE